MNTMQNSSTVVTFNPKTPKAPEGRAPFTITNIALEKNCPTQYGIRDKAAIDYTVNVRDINNVLKPVVITKRYLISNYPESQFDKLVVSALGKHVGKRFDLQELVGVSGIAEITHYTTEEGDVFAQVNSITVDFNTMEGIL